MVLKIRPAPPKQFAISEDAATYVLKDGYLIQPDNHTDSDWDETPLTSPVKQVQSSEDQMDGGHCQMNTLPPSWNKRAGVDENFDELNTGGKKLHESLRTSVESTHSIKTKVNDFKGSPKLYFFEGLTEVLSEKRNDDLALPRTLVSQTQKEPSMALVVWKPKPGISSYLQQWDKSKANSPSPVDELIKKKSNEEDDEKDVEMEMDTSP